jgi:CO/xanthine dehydrogenase Mo-binding subunit
MYQPLNMRFRGVSVYTNTPPRSAQRQPGGQPIVTMLEPLMDKAARELQIDRLQVRLINAPDGGSRFGEEQLQATSMLAREAMTKGAEVFGWEQKKALSGRKVGTKLTGVGIGCSPFHGGSVGFDGLMVIRPDGKLYVHQGVGNLGTHSFADTARAAADVLELPWESVQVLWGDSSRNLPWSSSQAGSQTTHAHTRANHAAAMDLKRKLQEIAARDLGGAPEAYTVSNGRVFRAGGTGMTLARAAQRAIQLGGKYDGHVLGEGLNAMTVASAGRLAGQGAMGVAKDTYAHEGETWSFVVGFAVVEVDAETGQVDIVEYTGVADCGKVVHPRSLGAQIHGGAVQGFGIARSQKWVFDPTWGANFTNRFYAARPPGILDVPLTMQWAALDVPDPQTPVGAKGIGEPPSGAASAAIVSAISDALGGKCLCQTPLTTDVILSALENRPGAYPILKAHV